MRKPLITAAICAGMLASHVPASAKDGYRGDCERASQVYDSLDLSKIVKDKTFKGYDMEPGTGDGACFKIAYYDMQFVDATADQANFVYKSREMWGFRKSQTCDTAFDVRPYGAVDAIFYGKLTLRRVYTQNEDKTCSVDLVADWTRRSDSYPALNQAISNPAAEWELWGDRLMSIHFPGFMRMMARPSDE